MHTAKQIAEQSAFFRFITRLGQDASWVSVESRPEPEPDLLCLHTSEGAIAFECVSITDPEIAKVLAAGSRARKDAFSTTDPTGKILQNKLHCSYTTQAKRIDLLVYTDGRVISTDGQITEHVLAWVGSLEHPFANVWYSGEREAGLLWSKT